MSEEKNYSSNTVSPFMGYDTSRVYLDVLVVPKNGKWTARCNGRRVSTDDRKQIITAAREVAVKGFSDYYGDEYKIKFADVRLEIGDNSWEFIASVSQTGNGGGA